MSRSFRKPYATEGYGTKRRKAYKRKANKKVKNAEELADGGAYKKVSESWDIRDYSFELPPTTKNRSK